MNKRLIHRRHLLPALITPALITLGLVLLAGCSNSDIPAPVLGTLERQRLDLVAVAAEPVVALPVQEGQRVTAGTLLAQLDTRRQDALVQQARAEVELAWQRLSEMEHGPRSEAIRRARNEVEAAQAHRDQAQKDLRRVRELVRRAVHSQAELDQAQTQFDASSAELHALRARLDELLAGTRSEQIAQARALWQAAQAQLAHHEVTLQRLSIYAPVDGIIDTLPLRVGEQPAAGATVLTMLDNSRLYARVYLPLEQRQALTVGTEARITLRHAGNTPLAVDGATLPQQVAGRVRWISSTAAFTPFFALNRHERGNLVYLAEVDVIDVGGGAGGEPGEELSATRVAGLPVSVSFPGLQLAAR